MIFTLVQLIQVNYVTSCSDCRFQHQVKNFPSKKYFQLAVIPGHPGSKHKKCHLFVLATHREAAKNKPGVLSRCQKDEGENIKGKTYPECTQADIMDEGETTVKEIGASSDERYSKINEGHHQCGLGRSIYFLR